MSWKKITQILDPEKLSPQTDGWLKTHCSIPTSLHLHDDIYRIYFYGRNADNHSQIGFAEIDLASPETPVKNLTTSPVLTLGPKGHFDESGIMPGCIIRPEHAPKQLWMYYTGWIQGVTVPFYVYIGLAISEDDGLTWSRHSNAPILGRHDYDPILTASPTIIQENGTFKMWYISATRWEETNDPSKPKHFYNIRYAHSKDGINWTRHPHPVIDYKNPEEYALARPCVVKENDTYKIWFSYRGGQDLYRIGYAESQDGINWNRQDEHQLADIQPTPEAWDSDMVCYAEVFNHNNQKFMLYNGNNYGKTGMGIAVYED